MKKIKILSVVFVVGAIVTSCVTESKQESKEVAVPVDTVPVVEALKEVKEEPQKEVKKETPKKQEQPIEEEPKVEEVPQEIGASPDAVSFLDDNENESTPKYPDGDKALKKFLKNNLRTAGRGETASFRASLVVKSDGSVGRVMFSECGYNDDYKSEIIAVLQSLSFTPGKKDGMAIDSWYYITYKR